jgi:flagellin-like protein
MRGTREMSLQLRRLVGDQRGVTGLETAIILIAFVVVASVFAFTVLSTGIFSAERGKETIHAGLKEARSSAELKGSVTANGVADKTLSLGDTAWYAGELQGTTTVFTVTASTTNKKGGTASANIVMTAAATTTLAGYENLASTIDLSSIDSIQLWVRSNIATDANDIEIVLDDTAGCTSPLENVDIPALVATTWKLATLAITDNSDMTAIKCVGLNVAVDNGAQTVNLDKVFGRGQATSVVMTLTNALGGEPLDLSEPSDFDNDGISDSDSTHVLILNYTDSKQYITDIHWTQTFAGDNDGDDLLEAGEKAELTITLSGLANATPVVKDVKFDIEIRPQDGGVMLVQRTMPDRIDTVMTLN